MGITLGPAPGIINEDFTYEDWKQKFDPERYLVSINEPPKLPAWIAKLMSSREDVSETNELAWKQTVQETDRLFEKMRRCIEETKRAYKRRDAMTVEDCLREFILEYAVSSGGMMYRDTEEKLKNIKEILQDDERLKTFAYVSGAFD